MSNETIRMSNMSNSGASGGGGGGGALTSSSHLGQISEDPNSSSDVKPVSIFSTDYKKYDSSHR